MLLHSAGNASPEITGLNVANEGITTLVPVTGKEPPAQLEVAFQLVLVTPSHVPAGIDAATVSLPAVFMSNH